MRYPKYLILIGVLLLTNCKEATDLPKPRAFPRVLYPERVYQDFKSDYCPFSFRFPGYAHIEKKSLYFDKKPVHECWYDLVIPSLGARVHFSYYPLDGSSEQFDNLLNDAHELAGQHIQRAQYIDDQFIQNQHGAMGFSFSLRGPVASPYQFFLTDSTRHFLRGALYFETQARQDSLEPVTRFIKQDLDSLIATLHWTE